ncbi:MAG TPA: lamin tail domain-containing protein [Kofleriaceae bacterium]|nr:lamin tail domain-containing protein [Kofleriaceae bacterium]
MRLALGLIFLPLSLVGCSQILGIQDPSTGDDGGRPDGGGGGIDAPVTGDHLQFTVASIAVAKGQRARFRVLRINEAGQPTDVTLDPMLSVTSDMPSGTLGTDTDTGVRYFTGVTDGNPMLHATYPGVGGASILASVTTFTCHPVINEFQTGGAATSDEFVEIYNPCVTPQLVDNWTLNYRAAATNGGTDNALLITLKGTMAVGELRLYANALYTAATPLDTWSNTGLLDKGGSVGLRDTNTKIVDSVGYGTAVADNPFVEGTPAPAPSAGQSMVRGPFDGRDNAVGAGDGDNKLDFSAATAPTPGTLNFP